MDHCAVFLFVTSYTKTPLGGHEAVSQHTVHTRPGLDPKWHCVSFIVHYFWLEPYGLLFIHTIFIYIYLLDFWYSSLNKSTAVHVSLSLACVNSPGVHTVHSESIQTPWLFPHFVCHGRFPPFPLKRIGPICSVIAVHVLIGKTEHEHKYKMNWQRNSPVWHRHRKQSPTKYPKNMAA